MVLSIRPLEDEAVIMEVWISTATLELICWVFK